MKDIVYTHRSRQSFLFKTPYIIFLERKKMNVLGCYINVDERGLFSRQFLSHALSCDNTEINSEMWMNNGSKIYFHYSNRTDLNNGIFIIHPDLYFGDK